MRLAPRVTSAEPEALGTARPRPSTKSTASLQDTSAYVQTASSRRLKLSRPRYLRKSNSRPHNLTSTPTMNIDTIPDFLAEQRDEAPADLQHLFISFEDLWERKLWHQLTDTLIEFFNHKESAAQRLPIYRTFILTFADKINQLKLVTLALSAATQCKGIPTSPETSEYF